jgi:hypothetical protein
MNSWCQTLWLVAIAMLSEEWRGVAGFPGYDVSTMGRVRSWLVPGHSGKRRARPLVLRSWVDRGYPRVALSSASGQVCRHVHRIVLETFSGACPYGMEAAHGNGVSWDCALTNLSWKTHVENMDDQRRHGTLASGARHSSQTKPHCIPRGSAHANSRLTEEQARSVLLSPLSSRALAAELKISPSNVRLIRGGKAWRHIRECAAREATNV